MIFPDINLLVYAENADSKFHAEANEWWNGILNTDREVAFTSTTILGFLRLMTNSSATPKPLTTREALNRLDTWLNRKQVKLIEPGPDHREIFFRLARKYEPKGSAVTDVHLAALAIENDWTLYSADSGFAKYSELRWINPLVTAEK